MKVISMRATMVGVALLAGFALVSAPSQAGDAVAVQSFFPVATRTVGTGFGSLIEVAGETAVVMTRYGSGLHVYEEYSPGLWLERVVLEAEHPYFRFDKHGSRLAMTGPDPSGDYLVAAKGRQSHRTGVYHEVVLFSGSGMNWTQTGQLDITVSSPDLVGPEIHMSMDQGRLAVAIGDSLIKTYRRSEAGWAQEAELRTPPRPCVADCLSDRSLVLSGNTLVLSEPHGADNAGAVDVYEYRTWPVSRWNPLIQTGSPSWRHTATLLATDGMPGDGFGVALAADGDTVLVGAPKADGAQANSGAMYVFTRGDSGWVQEGKLAPQNGLTADEFGTVVALDGNVAVAGSWVFKGSGSVHLFTRIIRRSSPVWVERARLVPGNRQELDEFGSAVAIEGNTVLVGAPGFELAGEKIGAAYVFACSTLIADCWNYQ